MASESVRIGDLPCTAIKGVGRSWATLMATLDLPSVGALAAISDEVLRQLITAAGARHILQIPILARHASGGQLPAGITLPGRSLYELGGEPASTFVRDYGLSVPEATLCTDTVGRAYIALKSVWLRRLTLRDLTSGRPWEPTGDARPAGAR
jgi:hypothetical protein